MSDGLQSISKVCVACLTMKPLTTFGANRRSADGRAYSCLSCLAAKRREDRKLQPEKYRAVEVRRWAKSGDVRGAKNREWYTQNREYAIAKARQWAQANPGKVSESSYINQRDRRRAMPSWANREAIAAIYEEARMLSALHGVPFEVDHIYPIKGKTVCGLHVESNLRVLEKEVNRAKGNRVEAACQTA